VSLKNNAVENGDVVGAEYEQSGQTGGALLVEDDHSVDKQTKLGYGLGSRFGHHIGTMIGPQAESRWRSLLKPYRLGFPILFAVYQAACDPHQANAYYHIDWAQTYAQHQR
jgi:hypothetical protein